MPSQCLLDLVVAILCNPRTQPGHASKEVCPTLIKSQFCSCLRSATSRAQIGNFSECTLPWVAAAHCRTGQEGSLFTTRLTINVVLRIIGVLATRTTNHRCVLHL